MFNLSAYKPYMIPLKIKQVLYLFILCLAIDFQKPWLANELPAFTVVDSVISFLSQFKY